MVKSITECRNEIRLIDKRIDEVRRELLSRETVDQMNSTSWGTAWAKHPALHEREHILFVRRADLKDELNAAERKVSSGYRTTKRKKCPACLGSGYGVAPEGTASARQPRGKQNLRQVGSSRPLQVPA